MEVVPLKQLESFLSFDKIKRAYFYLVKFLIVISGRYLKLTVIIQLLNFKMTINCLFSMYIKVW